MHTAEIIQKTANKIFDFYKTPNKGIFNLSIIYSIIWGLIALFVTVPILILLSIIGIGEEYEIFSSWMDSRSIYNIRLIQYVMSIYIMSIPVFGMYILNKKPDEKYSIESLFKSLNQQEWITWILLTLGILFIYTTTFTFMFSSYEDNYFGQLIQNATGYYYGYWPGLMVELVKEYLPYFTGMLFLLICSNKLNQSLNKKNIIFAVLIMAFIINTLSQGILNFYYDYIATFFKMIPFLDRVFPLLLGLVIQIAFGAYIFPAITIAFSYPFKLMVNDSSIQHTQEDHTPIL